MTFKKEAKFKYKKLSETRFAPLLRGDIVLTNHHSSLLAKAIRLKGRKDSGECKVNHAELYIGSGLSIAAELTINIHPIKKFFTGKHDVYVFRNTKLTQAQRNQLVSDSFVFHGRFYDVLGIVGQAMSYLTRMGIWAKLVNSSNSLYCSELVAKVYKQTIPFLPQRSYKIITPDDIFDYCWGGIDWNCVYTLLK